LLTFEFLFDYIRILVRARSRPKLNATVVRAGLFHLWAIWKG